MDPEQYPYAIDPAPPAPATTSIDPMRRFAQLCVAAGILLAVAFPIYAAYETDARSRRESDWLLNYMRGPRPVATPVSPWPGVYSGAGLAAFGVLLLAIRRPTEEGRS